MKEFTRDHVRELRQNMTDAEKHLWYFLRAKRLNGHKFRRQHLVHPFIVDFICPSKKLIIEIDGGQHAEQLRYDEKRSVFLKSQGYRVIRFWNIDVFKQTQSVLNTILNALNENN
ncbi:MAG: hypothetical protein ACD_45C00603G0001 [uncultured bacterium]|nr:MAG: hypothetical protein ACD_45C00603G0001 [uncultured bacterium]